MSIAKPIRLQINKKYPSYQLYAIAGTVQIDSDSVLKACILHTYKWLRARFRGFSLSELDVPDPSDVSCFDLASISSFSITDPYPMEVIWLPADKAWSFKLTEPDNGNEATDYRPARDAVPGRLFETNIGYRISDTGVECGFKTIVSEPEGVDAPVESFRLMCIKEIARDPNIGLYHGYKLQDEPFTVNSSADVKRLIRWIRSYDRQMPVIISDLGVQKPNKKDLDAIAVADQILSLTSLTRFSSVARVPGLTPPSGAHPVTEKQSSGNRTDIISLARYKMGYAQYFLVTKEMSELISKEFPSEYRQGDIMVFEPAAFGGHIRPYSAFDSKTEQGLDLFASDYPAKKPMTFGNVLFTNDARELSSKRVAELADSKEALAQAYEERIAAIRAKHEDEIASYHSRLDDEIRENHRLEKEIENLRAEYEKIIGVSKKRHEEELEQRSSEHEKDLRELERFRSRDRRPVDISGIQRWIENEFKGKLILHEKAQKLLSALKPGEWDVELICDALEFLATDYRDELIGIITEDEMNANCSDKYGRPFEVTPLSFPSVQGAPKEYKIKYKIGHKGKPVESVLNLHLRIGNTAEDLIRIYFLYDSDKQLIVVGSLPKHLPTLSYR